MRSALFVIMGAVRDYCCLEGEGGNDSKKNVCLVSSLREGRAGRLEGESERKSE
jgi:hypothetical protein